MSETMRRIAGKRGAALRAAWARRRPVRHWALVAGASVLLLGGTVLSSPRPRLVWNASPSAPIGLYWVAGPEDVGLGDMVIARLPEGWRDLASERRYIPLGVPLVKRVAAAAGDTVCAAGGVVSVNGAWAAARRRADSRGRPMPWWEGCVLLQDGAVLLLTPDPASFDGRYFGVTKGSDIVGRARLLWAR